MHITDTPYSMQSRALTISVNDVYLFSKIMKQISKPEQKIIAQQERLKQAILKSKRSLRSADEEFEAAFKILQKHPKRVTIFGSARLSPKSKYYQLARKVAGDLSGLGYAIMSGGGGGIMEAGDRGAFEAEDVAIVARAESVSSPSS